jgi:hypothetical protein
MINLGDRAVGTTLAFDFNTHQADGTPITLAGTPAISVYKNSTTESTSGVTLTVDYDSRTGMHHVVIDTSANGTFYATDNDFSVVVTTGTVNSISVVGTVVARFSLGRANVSHITSTAQTARDIGASVLLSSGTGTGQLDFTSGVVKANAVQILGTAVSTPATAGILDVNLKNIANAAVNTSSAQIGVNVVSQANIDFGALQKTSLNAATPASVVGAVGSVTGNVGGSVASVAANGITSTSIAADAINAASVKADAVTKIQNGLATPTNITAGVITTVTNLTNAPTAGDFTATMKTSITTAATAATPTVTVGTNNDKTGYSLAADQAVNVTKWNGTAVATPATAGIPEVNVKNINNVATTSVTTISAYQGHTQPLNFTGTGVSALIKSDTVDIAGAAVSTSLAQIGVNVVNVAGTAQTGRDLGASVLVSSGTGTGQLSLNAGVIASNTTHVDGIALSTHYAGMLPADLRFIVGTAVSTTIAQLGVNMVQCGTTPVTARDIGASVLLSVGGGTGQVDVSGGVVKSNLVQVDGITLTTHSAGKVPADMRDIAGTTVSTTIAQIGVNVVSSTGGIPATGDIADAVWDEALSGHSTAGTAGKALTDAGGGASASTIADAVWDEALSGHTTAGTAGKALTDAGAGGDPWSTALPGAYGAGSAGYILGTNLNATISSVAAGVWTNGTRTLTGSVTVGTNNDKTGYSISGTKQTLDALNDVTAAGVWASGARTLTSFGTLVADTADAVWDEATSGHTTGGTTGKALADAASITPPSSSAIADAVWDEALSGHTTAGTSGKALGDAGAISVPSAASVADAVWDEATSGHTTVGTTGKALTDAGAAGTPPSVADIADGVWDEAISGHLTAGSTGAKLNSAASAGDPWSTSLPGSYGAGTAGKILGSTLAADVVAINGQATNGYNATLKLKMLDINNTTGDAVTLTSTDDYGLHVVSGSDIAIFVDGASTGIYTSGGTSGMTCEGKVYGKGIIFTGGTDSGSAMTFYGHELGVDIQVEGTGVSIVSGVKGIDIASVGVGLAASSSSASAVSLNSDVSNGIDITADVNGITIASDTNGIDISTGGKGINIAADDYGIYAVGTSAYGAYFQGALGFGIKGTSGDGLQSIGGGDGTGATFNGYGNGAGIGIRGGSGGAGVLINGRGGSDAMTLTAEANAHGLAIYGYGAGNGIYVIGGATNGNGIYAKGDGTNGSGMKLKRGGIGGHDLTFETPDCTIDSNIVSIDGEITSAELLALSSKTIATDTIDDTSFVPTVTEFEVSTLDDADTAHWRDRWVIFIDGPLARQARVIRNYTLESGKGHFVCDALTQAPADGDRFIIV